MEADTMASGPSASTTSSGRRAMAMPPPTMWLMALNGSFRATRSPARALSVPSGHSEQDPAVRHDEPGEDQRHRVDDLDQGVDGRAGRVLVRVADGVADDGRLVRVGALAALLLD